ncbi:helix-turn-helix domain-containing protein [Bosea sp. 124]|uniref:helix-turn-helix domain-containing protein n=1 Tax=Bosea sp. 124 TaxID=2135642 RepID=UPI000D42A094|nr:helix-turn-helix domain-containing protein [Bosea sp. 124]PTM41519.1 helix-turn-helix protein [Bosea sp. 124]
MSRFRREVQHKLRVLRHAEQIGDVGKACRYFGVGRTSFYRWKAAYQRDGEAGLVNRMCTAVRKPSSGAPAFVPARAA